MNESQWLASADPQPMLSYLNGRLSERKARLFAAACCRRVWDVLTHERCRKAVETAERFADGLASPQMRGRRYNQVMGIDWSRQTSPSAAQATYNSCAQTGREAAVMSSYCIGQGHPDQKPAMAALMRCIAGNPFRVVGVCPDVLAWERGTVVSLAQAAYDGPAFDRLPILADALEEAGAVAGLVAHLRDGGPHARGCWVLDLILGRG